MSDLELMVDFYIHLPRQGPGDKSETVRAMEYTGLGSKENLKIADIGCGTGAQTLTLAEKLKGNITAVDIFPGFLKILNKNASKAGFQNCITTDVQSMDKLPYEDDSFNLIWSEGAVYIMGFEEGIKSWKPLIRKGGFLVVSEISWFTESRPQELEDYWQAEYPGMDTINNKEKVLIRNGYELVSSFKIPEYCWQENYYYPIRIVIPDFLARHRNNKKAINLVEELEREIEMYEKFSIYYGYAFYIAQKTGE